ncbi:MAG: sulfatase-like hydrolase/transferase [Planctomycetes bacterium]|nr:sulfatase-like hydrolase/transferase [Planctomycetota bacterium]
MDASIGTIMEALKNAGIDDNTIVIFTSDNGPWTMFNEFGGVATPMRGEKSTTWEGGDRVPCLVRWPGQIKPGLREELMLNYDMYATLANITGSDIPAGHAIDSLDASNYLLKGTASPRIKHVHYFHQPMAFRKGKYKLHFFTRERSRDPITGKRDPNLTQDPPLLFDMSKDPQEKQNIASLHPEMVRQLSKEYEKTVEAIKTWKPF